MKTLRELARAVDPERNRVAGAIRRMAITLTSKVLWQLTGYEVDGETETFTAEPFTGIGFAARPPNSSKPEAVVVMIGDAQHPVIIAVRDEKTRAAAAAALGFKADEAAIFNSKAAVHVKDDSTIEARSLGGTAEELGTKKDLRYMREAIAALVGGAAALAAIDAKVAGNVDPAATTAAQWPRGTKKLKGE